jgi:predicted branched-subunit amino acid permease
MTTTTTSSPTITETRLAQFWAGVQGVFPLLVGDFPFGLIYGAMAIKGGIPLPAAQAMSSLVFAGSAQFMIAQMVTAAVPGLVITLAIIVINLRHALYSASIAPYIQHLNDKWKLVLSYILTDEAYVTAVTRYEKVGVTPLGHWYYLGAGVSLWVVWQFSTFLGIQLGQVIPASWPLDFFLPLTFIAMVIPILKDRPTIGAAFAAGAAAVIAYSLPYKLSIILAALVGILVGLWLEKKS